MHCDKCPFETKSVNAFKNHHAKVHATFTLFKCSKCDYSSLRKSYAEHHEQQHIPKCKTGYACEFCNFSNKSRVELRRHLYSKHQVKDKDVEPFKCPRCPYESYLMDVIKKHVKVHVEGRFDCDKCPFKGKTQQELVKHKVYLHGYESPFKCLHCSYVSYHMDAVKRHAKVHAEERFNCDKCPFKGKIQQELVKHRVDLHSYKPRFKCSHCSYVCDRLSMFRDHTKVHMEGRFDCEKCPFKGVTRKELVKHQVENHGYQLPFKCPKCDFCTYTKPIMRAHEKNLHKNKT